MTARNNATTLWQRLEDAHEVPESRDLRGLSGLSEPGVQRLARLWPDLSAEVRRNLIQKLCDMAEADFVLDFSAVFRFALDDDIPPVRAGSIEGLWEVEDIRLIKQFAQMLAHDPALVVRVAAAQALARFVLLGELRRIPPRSFEIARTALLRAHHDSDEDLEVQRRALESLAYTGLDGVPELIGAAYEHEDERMRISAVFSMGRSADKRWTPIVQPELHNPQPEMRYEATRACGELEATEAVPTLVELTEDVDQEVQEMALWSLGQIGGRVARRTLNDYLNDDNEALRAAARVALQELEFLHSDLSTFFGPPEAFDGESDVRWTDPRHPYAGPDYDEEDEVP